MTAPTPTIRYADAIKQMRGAAADLDTATRAWAKDPQDKRIDEALDRAYDAIVAAWRDLDPHLPEQDPESFLEGFEVSSVDEPCDDPDLTCARCGDVLCPIEHGDGMDTLYRFCRNHRCKPASSASMTYLHADEPHEPGTLAGCAACDAARSS